MDMMQQLRLLSQKIKDGGKSITTEEGTKNAFIMPFIWSVLGYDVFNPNEVIPEYTTDVGTKKGEKIDYAIIKDGVVQVLVECKKYGEPLNINHASQLYRYFAVSNARIAVLTNGQIYQFFTDLDEKNRMDERPFLELDLLNIDEHLIPELEKLSKESFNLDSVIGAAEELKYLNQVKKIISRQLSEPDQEFISYFARQIYSGPVTQKIRDQFSGILMRGFVQYINDQINDRLKSAIVGSPAASPSVSSDQGQDVVESESSSSPSEEGSIVTTEEELEGYRIVRAILRKIIDVGRVFYRDGQSYFAIILDDNNRKTVCRLHLNRSKKYIGFIGDDKKETRHLISSLDEIYGFSDQICASAQSYLDAK